MKKRNKQHHIDNAYTENNGSKMNTISLFYE